MEVLNKTEENDFWKFKGCQEFIDEWFLMSNPFSVLIILSAYLLFVLKLGPDYMKKQRPMKLDNIILMYDFAQVLLSTYMFCKGIELHRTVGLLHSNCSLERETHLYLASNAYIYFSAKISELLDTVFFVLRKKDSQVTFLHVYHHSMVVFFSWWFIKYEPLSLYTCMFLGTINSFIHMAMYTYYALSSFPGLSKYLWWKKYITSMQLIQFVAILLHMAANYYFGGCRPTTFILSVVTFNVLLFIYLFGDFYIKSYNKETEDKKSKILLEHRSATKKNSIQFTGGIQNHNGHEKMH